MSAPRLYPTYRQALGRARKVIGALQVEPEAAQHLNGEWLPCAIIQDGQEYLVQDFEWQGVHACKRVEFEATKRALDLARQK